MDGWVGEFYYIAIFLGEISTVEKYSQFSWVGGGGGGGELLWGKLLFDSNLRAMINKRNQVSLLIFFSLFSVVVLLINNDLDSEKLKPIVAS